MIKDGATCLFMIIIFYYNITCYDNIPQLFMYKLVLYNIHIHILNSMFRQYTLCCSALGDSF